MIPNEPQPNGDVEDGEPQPQIVVDDPEDFAKTRQLRSIFDARDAYVDARREANELQEEGEITHPEKHKRIFRHAQDFVMALEPLLRKHDAEILTDKTYRLDSAAWKNDIASAEDAIAYCRENNPEMLQKYQDKKKPADSFGTNTAATKLRNRMVWAASDTGVEFDGLQELISRTPRLKYLRADEKDIGTSAPPQWLSDEVFRDLQRFIDEIGLGFDMKETQQTKIDDDVLKELDQWRSQNI